MVNVQTGFQTTDPSPSEIDCDLCVVGAGIAGLNALFVAAEYLPRTARVVLIDRNARCGGMWNTTYDYVRLHQPHPMFTAGDIKWRLNKPREYLATRAEVLDHMQHCLDTIRRRVTLLELFEHDFVGSEEIETPEGPRARIVCRPSSGAEPTVTITAHRLINAVGLSVPVLQPLALSSGSVKSTTPTQMYSDGTEAVDTPAYVVGGGKTGMDTVARLLRLTPGRKVVLINGKGTVFANRDFILPPGSRRWWQGQLLLKTFADLAMRFDGDNEEQAFDYFRKTYAISPTGQGEQFFFGLLGEDERDAISVGLTETVGDYLEDVIDTPTGPQIVFRSGKKRQIESDAIIVNCTGHILRQSQEPLPCISARDTTLNVSPRDAVHFLSSVSAYFLTHLLFLGRIREAGLYSMDVEALLRHGRKVWHMSSVSLSFYNTIRLVDALPFKAVDRCGLDFDRWYPLPRRMMGLIDLKRNQRRYLAHCKRALDRVHERLGVPCGPLGHASQPVPAH